MLTNFSCLPWIALVPDTNLWKISSTAGATFITSGKVHEELRTFIYMTCRGLFMCNDSFHLRNSNRMLSIENKMFTKHEPNLVLHHVANLLSSYLSTFQQLAGAKLSSLNWPKIIKYISTLVAAIRGLHKFTLRHQHRNIFASTFVIKAMSSTRLS